MTQPVHANPHDSRADKVLFAIVFVAGTAAILGTKLAGAPRLAPVVVAVAALLLYAVLVSRVERFRLREDRAGDNAYYLGFLFTLVSLSYALSQFKVQDPAAIGAVIDSFALALSSTIIGLAIRVWFQQLREDPQEFEQDARLALGQATIELRQQLIGVIEDVTLLRKRVDVELREDFIGRARALTEAATDAMRQVAAEHGQWLQTVAAQLKDDRQEVLAFSATQKASLTRLTNSLHDLVKRIDRAELPVEAFSRRLDELLAAWGAEVDARRSKAASESGAFELAASAFRDVSRATAGLEERVVRVVAMSDSVADSLGRSKGAVQELVAAVTAGSGTILKASREHAAEIEALATRSRVLQSELAKVTAVLADGAADRARDLVAVKRELVAAVDALRRDIDGGRNSA
jgi:hypothetical protein